MKNLILSLLWLVSAGPALAAGEGGRLNNSYIVASLSPYERCVIGSSGLGCGYDSGPLAGQMVSDLSAGTDGHYCAVLNSEIKCWGGHNEFGQAFSPKFGAAQTVVAGYNHSCAFGDFGVRCWGGNQNGELQVPPLKNPLALAGYGSSNCVLEENRVKCWGEIGPVDQSLKSARQITVGKNFACAVDSEGLQCWGDKKLVGEIPRVSDALWINAWYNRLCVLRPGNQLQCWAAGKPVDMPLNGRRIIFLKNELCLRSKNENVIYCPARDLKLDSISQEKNPLYFASLLNPRFDLDDLPGFLSVVAESGGGGRMALAQELLAHTAEFTLPDTSKSAALGRYLLATLLAPAVLSNDSDFSRSQVTPAFQESMAGFESALGVRGTDEIPVDAGTLRQAWVMAQASLSTVSSFLPLEDRTKIQSALRTVGQAGNDPGNDTLRLQAVSGLQEILPLVERMKASPKSAFLAEILSSVLRFTSGERK